MAALSEWVISKNLRPDKNIADDYIDMIQSNASRLDTMNQTIKKYNQAYTYCVQGSKDLAVIQLKKVLSLNPRLIRAHQLLALLYIDSEQWDKAKKEVKKCLDIDRNNTLALRYLKEVDLMLNPDASCNTAVKRKSEDSVRYQSDNEIIIQPLNVKETKRSGVSTLLNIGLGMIIGLAAMFFLVLPGRIAEVNNEANAKIAEIGNQSDAKTATITELESRVKGLEADIDRLNQELEGYVGTDGTLNTIDTLLSAAATYLETKDAAQTGASLEEISAGIDVTQTSEAFQKLYNSLFTVVGSELAQTYYKEGKTAYESSNYAEAITSLTNAVYYDDANADALYYLGQAYRKNNDTENAINTYKKVVELFPGTDRATKSQEYIDRLSQ